MLPENINLVLTFGLWTVFVAYLTWFLTSAKHYAPISPFEGRILWEVHRRSAQCNGRGWQQIKKGGKIVGFKCECGYKHMQLRPIVAGVPPLHVKPEDSKVPVLDTVHAVQEK
jgi:hypothetical protein